MDGLLTTLKFSQGLEHKLYIGDVAPDTYKASLVAEKDQDMNHDCALSHLWVVSVLIVVILLDIP